MHALANATTRNFPVLLYCKMLREIDSGDKRHCSLSSKCITFCVAFWNLAATGLRALMTDPF